MKYWLNLIMHHEKRNVNHIFHYNLVVTFAYVRCYTKTVVRHWQGEQTMVKNLRMLRENMGLSQEKLAVLTGLTARRVFSYEREPNEPDIETLALLADFFGVTIDFLVGHTEDEAECAPSNSLNLTRFGVRIRQFRESKSMERPELAKRVGVTSAYLGLIENGGKIPKLETCLKILNALGMSADAAFMDNLDAAVPRKANLLQSKIVELPPEKQRFVLNLLESMIEAMRE